MTDAVFDDPDSRTAEALAFDAEQAERRGEHATARAKYAEAAELDLRLALRVSGRPRSRAVLAVEAVCLFARAGRYDRAIEAAERLLAEPGALAPSGVEQLEALLHGYRRTVEPLKMPSAAPTNSLLVMRRTLRAEARRAA